MLAAAVMFLWCAGSNCEERKRVAEEIAKEGKKNISDGHEGIISYCASHMSYCQPFLVYASKYFTVLCSDIGS